MNTSPWTWLNQWTILTGCELVQVLLIGVTCYTGLYISFFRWFCDTNTRPDTKSSRHQMEWPDDTGLATSWLRHDTRPTHHLTPTNWHQRYPTNRCLKWKKDTCGMQMQVGTANTKSNETLELSLITRDDRSRENEKWTTKPTIIRLYIDSNQYWILRKEMKESNSNLKWLFGSWSVTSLLLAAQSRQTICRSLAPKNDIESRPFQSLSIYQRMLMGESLRNTFFGPGLFEDARSWCSSFKDQVHVPHCAIMSGFQTWLNRT